MNDIEYTLWMSSKNMTVLVGINGGKIISAPPIVSKFIGQSVTNLRNWMKTQGKFLEKKIE